MSDLTKQEKTAGCNDMFLNTSKNDFYIRPAGLAKNDSLYSQMRHIPEEIHQVLNSFKPATCIKFDFQILNEVAEHLASNGYDVYIITFSNDPNKNYSVVDWSLGLTDGNIYFYTNGDDSFIHPDSNTSCNTSDPGNA